MPSTQNFAEKTAVHNTLYAFSPQNDSLCF